ncbi:MAG: hypothetical protein AAGF92_09345 [Myxococcota bacterium]
MKVFAQRLAGADKKNRPQEHFTWITNTDEAETRALLTQGVANRIGSWVDGNEFQIALSADPTTPVLFGTLRSLSGGTEVNAIVSFRSEVRDILRLGRLLLLGFLAVMAVALPFQAEGSELATALVGLALGCASTAALASLIEARIASRLGAPNLVADLTRSMQRLLS